MTLSQETCIPCRDGAPTLSQAELDALMLELPGWQVVNGHHLLKSWPFPDFQQALAILAPQRLPELDIVTALQTLVEKIIAAGGPSVSGVSVPNIAPTSIFAKLTDGSLYTGTHKNRFDEDGVGLGKLGRE